MQQIIRGKQHCIGVLCGVQSRLQSFYSRRVHVLMLPICMVIRLALLLSAEQFCTGSLASVIIMFCLGGEWMGYNFW